MGEILNALVYVTALRNNLLLLHSSCVKVGDQVFIFVAPPNTGKSTLVFSISKENGGRIVSEDITPCLFEDGQLDVFPNLYTSTFLKNSYVIRSEFGKAESLRLRLDNALRDAPILPFFMKFASDTSEAYKVLMKRGTSNRPFSSMRTTVVFLERNSSRALPGLAEKDPKDSLNELLFLNRMEFEYWSEVVLFLLSKWDRSFELQNIANQEELLIGRLLGSSRIVRAIGRNVGDFKVVVKSLLKDT